MITQDTIIQTIARQCEVIPRAFASDLEFHYGSWDQGITPQQRPAIYAFRTIPILSKESENEKLLDIHVEFLISATLPIFGDHSISIQAENLYHTLRRTAEVFIGTKLIEHGLKYVIADSRISLFGKWKVVSVVGDQIKYLCEVELKGAK
jgi:hypothetical protein